MGEAVSAWQCARLTLGSILVFFGLRHFSAHRSQFGCVIPDLDKNRNPFNRRRSSVKSLLQAPGAEIRALRTRGRNVHQDGPLFITAAAKGAMKLDNGAKRGTRGVYQLDVNESVQPRGSLRAHTHTHTAQGAICAPHAFTYLISSTFSATSMHIDEGKRSHHESRYVASKKKKDKRQITTCTAVTKKRSKTKDKSSAGFVCFF